MKNSSLFILCVSLLFGSIYTQAQQIADTNVYYAFDKKPEFPGGNQAMMKFIATHIRYPDEARNQGVTGNVYASFVVEPDGSLSHVKIIKGLGFGCNAEVKRIIFLMPKWQPGLVGGKPVRSYVTQEVSFRMKPWGNVTRGDRIYTKVDSLPTFAVGKQGVEHFLISRLWYPKRTVRRNVVDTVYVNFVVEKDNRITQIRLMKPKTYMNAYDFEAIRVVSLLPVVRPAILDNKPARCRLYVPVVFDHKDVHLNGGQYKTAEYNFQEYKYFVPKDHMPIIHLSEKQSVQNTKIQKDSLVPDTGQIFVVVEKMPHFPGGPGAFMQYLAKHTHYPAEAVKKGCIGRIFINFVIERDGSISHIKVLRGICPSLDKEAVSVIKNMPKWIPGYQRGKPVRVSFNLPIKFTTVR